MFNWYVSWTGDIPNCNVRYIYISGYSYEVEK